MVIPIVVVVVGFVVVVVGVVLELNSNSHLTPDSFLIYSVGVIQCK